MMQDHKPQPVVNWVSVYGGPVEEYDIWTMDQFPSDTHRIVIRMHDGKPVAVTLEEL
jgi:hypothetical protein